MGWMVQFFLYGFVMLKEKKVKLLSMSMDCSLAGFSIHGIFQARILEWVAISFSRNWCFSTVVLEKTLESPLDCKEIKPVNSKRNPSWIFIGRTVAEAPILWPPDAKSQLIRKGPDAGKDWRQEEKGMIEDEMAGWHHRLNGHEFEQALGDGKGQGSLACCSPWCHKELDMTEQLNWLTCF